MKFLTKNIFLALVFLLLSITSSFSATEVQVNNGFENFKNRMSLRMMNRMLPRVQQRFCHLKVRPEAVVLILGLTSTEWNISRLCETKFPIQ